ncbi:MAG: hypothetical protein ACR2IA_10090 [Pyrinomonadaceae bacterium]
MKSSKFSFLLSAVLGLFLAVSAFAQNQTFSDANAEYVFDLPENAWKMTTKPSALSPNVEYVYNDRRDGHLEIRKLALKSGELLSELIRDEEEKLQFLKGYVAGKEEPFAGNLKGTIFNYEYVRSGRNMSGRFYFLKADDSNVYVIRFTGERDKLRSIRNQTDLIARTFETKKAK